MAEIDDLDFIDDDDPIYPDSISDDGVIVDNDDWGIDDDNEDLEESEDISEEQIEEQKEVSEQSDVISEILKSKGILDSSKIKFENESGEIEERDWKDLSIEELMNILQNELNEVDDNSDLDDYEIDLINRIRLSGMSVSDYINYEKQMAVKQYADYMAQQNPLEPSYVVDDFTDEELYMLDLQTKIPDITDEELEQALDQVKTNPDLFAKQMAGLRNEYIELEQNKIAREQAIEELTQRELFEQFSGAVINSIQNFLSIGDLDINMEDADANELYNFITGTDAAGINYFAKALNDPDTLTRVAWFALHGEDVINSIQDYYNGVIAQVSKSQYEKGRQSVKAKEKKTPDVVVNPTKTNKNSRKYATIYDLD